ncbi:TIGR04100 family radical SAM protein [Oscillospiraceae bacterium PP1C4]
MADILYVFEGNLYINLTNQCPCNCTFCIRSHGEGQGTAESLWLTREPSSAEVIAEFGKYNLSDFEEVVFCGYGEPLNALDTLLCVCKYIRSISNIKIRINTNGLGDVINGKPTAPLLKDHVDIVSISLNAPNAEKYNELCHPVYGLEAFPAILKFANDCKQYVPMVKFTVVDVISKQDIENCKQLSQDMGIKLRVRNFSD